jgi:hypothetical protein
MGPNLQFHLAGGAGGIKHFFEGVFAGLLPMFKVLGNPNITPELEARVAEGVLQEAGDQSVEQLAQDENQKLVALLRLRAEGAAAPGAKEKLATVGAS